MLAYSYQHSIHSFIHSFQGPCIDKSRFQPRPGPCVAQTLHRVHSHSQTGAINDLDPATVHGPIRRSLPISYSQTRCQQVKSKESRYIYCCRGKAGHTGRKNNQRSTMLHFVPSQYTKGNRHKSPPSPTSFLALLLHYPTI